VAEIVSTTNFDGAQNALYPQCVRKVLPDEAFAISKCNEEFSGIFSAGDSSFSESRKS
jgi:hypothetical protein